MFTGLVLGIGKVQAVRPAGTGRRFEVDAGAVAAKVHLGDSVAVSGVCLTAVEIAPPRLAFDVVAETLSRTTLGRLRPGDEVNLELPLTPTDRLGGHFVQGHVDGVGKVLHAGMRGADWILEVSAPPDLARYLVEKGSISIDGVSLTLTRAGRDSLAVSLIPHTREVTTLGRLRSGSEVNLEVDLLAKYVEKLMGTRT